MRLSIGVVGALFLGAALAQAQSSSPVVQRDPQAVAVIQQALAAFGGQAAIAQVQTVIAQGSMVAVPGTNAPAGNFVWKDQFTAQGHEFRDTFESGGRTQVFISGHGNPGHVSNGHVRKFTPHVAQAALPIHLPALILAGDLANADYDITLVGPTAINGQAVIRVHLHIDTDIVRQTLGVQDWYFDPVTGLPLRVEYRVPDTTDASMYLTAAADYSNFRVVQGVTIPFSITASQDGNPRNLITISSASINPPIAPTDFDLPTGGGL